MFPTPLSNVLAVVVIFTESCCNDLRCNNKCHGRESGSRSVLPALIYHHVKQGRVNPDISLISYTRAIALRVITICLRNICNNCVCRGRKVISTTSRKVTWKYLKMRPVKCLHACNRKRGSKRCKTVLCVFVTVLHWCEARFGSWQNN